jgi:VanZ family protein
LPPIPWDFLSPDKIGHLVFYAVQTFLLIWAFAKSQEWKEIKVVGVVLAMLIAASYGTSLEFVQANIPGRAFDYADMVANFVGTFIGIYGFKLLVASYK